MDDVDVPADGDEAAQVAEVSVGGLGRVSVAAEYGVAVSIDDDAVIAGVAVDDGVVADDHDLVVAVAAMDLRRRTPQRDVRRQGDRVVARTAEQQVGAAAAQDGVVARPALDPVRPGVAGQYVGIGAAEQVFDRHQRVPGAIPRAALRPGRR